MGDIAWIKIVRKEGLFSICDRVRSSSDWGYERVEFHDSEARKHRASAIGAHMFQCVFTAGIRDKVKTIQNDKADFAKQSGFRFNMILLLVFG